MKTMKKETSNQKWWWIAINGASCAAYPVDSRHVPTVAPTPEQLIGYRTQHEQLAAQRLILREPMEQVNEYLEGLPSRIQSGELRYVRPAEPEPPTHGQTHWIFPSDEVVQDVLPRQIPNSTTTPTLRSLIPKEAIEPLKKLGHTDWLKIVSNRLGHRFELDEGVLETLADHPDFLQMMLHASRLNGCLLIQFLAYSKLLANGPKIVQPSAEQCEALTHVDLNLKFRDYEQPFPAFVIELPVEIQRQLTEQYSVTCPRFAIPYYDRANDFLTVFCEHGGGDAAGSVCTVYSRNSLDEMMEMPLQKVNGEDGSDFRQGMAIQRIALNLSLLLTRYGFEENGALDAKAFRKQLRATKSKSASKRHRAQRLLDSSFSAISLSQDVQFLHKAEPGLSVGQHEGVLKSPHWRRGHFRRARVGTGRSETRLVFVRPSFINAGQFKGDLSDTQYRIRTNKAVVINSA